MGWLKRQYDKYGEGLNYFLIGTVIGGVIVVGDMTYDCAMVCSNAMKRMTGLRVLDEVDRGLDSDLEKRVPQIPVEREDFENRV